MRVPSTAANPRDGWVAALETRMIYLRSPEGAIGRVAGTLESD